MVVHVIMTNLIPVIMNAVFIMIIAVDTTIVLSS